MYLYPCLTYFVGSSPALWCLFRCLVHRFLFIEANYGIINHVLLETNKTCSCLLDISVLQKEVITACHVPGFLNSLLNKGLMSCICFNYSEVSLSTEWHYIIKLGPARRTGEYPACCSLSAISNCFRSSGSVMCHFPSHPALPFPLINVKPKWTQLKLHIKGVYVV